MKISTRNLLIVFFILVIVKIILSYFNKSPSIFSDEYIYSKMARSFFYEGTFKLHGIPTHQYPPLYPILLSIAYFFSDMKIVFFLFKVINSVLITSMIFPIYYLAKDFLSSKKSLFIAILISLIPISMVFPSYIMSENLFYPLAVFTIFLIYKAFKHNSMLFFFLSGLFLGLSYLTKIFGLAFIPIVFIIYLLTKKNEKTNPYNIIIHYATALAVVFPWLIRNIKQFGFSLSGLLGTYTGDQSTTSEFLIGSFLNWLVLYSTYLILASGVFFALYFVLGLRSKDKDYSRLISIVLLFGISTILMASFDATRAFHQAIQPIFGLSLSRPIGRYAESILPLIILLGFISFNKIKENKKTLLVITAVFSAILFWSVQLTLFPLFLINNLSLTFLGITQYMIEFFLLGKISFDTVFNVQSFFIMAIVMALLPFIIYKTRKNIVLFQIMIAFFLLSSGLAYSVVIWNSSNNWENHPHLQFGSWINENINQTSKFMIDSRSKGMLSKEKQKELYNELAEGSYSTFLGFWINHDIIIDSIENAKNYDYVISTEKLPYKEEFSIAIEKPKTVLEGFQVTVSGGQRQILGFTTQQDKIFLYKVN